MSNREQFIWDSHKEDCTHGVFEGKETSIDEFIGMFDESRIDDVTDAVETTADQFAEEGKTNWRVTVFALKNLDGSYEFDYRVTVLPRKLSLDARSLS